MWQGFPSQAGGFYKGSVPVSVSGRVRGGLDSADVGCEGHPLPWLVGQSRFFRERDSGDGNVSHSSRPCKRGKGVPILLHNSSPIPLPPAINVFTLNCLYVCMLPPPSVPAQLCQVRRVSPTHSVSDAGQRGMSVHSLIPVSCPHHRRLSERDSSSDSEVRQSPSLLPSSKRRFDSSCDRCQSLPVPILDLELDAEEADIFRLVCWIHELIVYSPSLLWMTRCM